MEPTRRAVLAATVSSIALAGCAGSPGGGSDATPTPTETPTEAPTETATASSTATTTATPSAAPTVQVNSHPELDEILVDFEGMTLYMFDSDTQGEGASACSGGCADAWPPLTVEGDPSAGSGVTAELTTFERADGSTQVAANGWPLYYYASDSEAGDATGQGANDVWWVLDSAGRPVRPQAASTPSPTETPTRAPTATPTETSESTPTPTDDGGVY